MGAVLELMKRGRLVLAHRVSVHLYDFNRTSDGNEEVRIYDLRAVLASQEIASVGVRPFLAVLLGITIEDPIAFFADSAEEAHDRSIRVVTAILRPWLREADFEPRETAQMRACASCELPTPIEEQMPCGGCGAGVCQGCYAKNSGTCGAPTEAPMPR